MVQQAGEKAAAHTLILTFSVVTDLLPHDQVCFLPETLTFFRGTQVFLTRFRMVLFSSSAPVSHDRAAVSQRAQCEDLETKATEWNPAMINFIMYTQTFLYSVMSNCLK